MACRLPVFLRLLPAVLVCVALPALATPPAAPSGLAAFLTKTSQTVSYPHSYAFLWNDNASDESGFEVGYRIGTSGSFATLISEIAANTTGQVLNLSALPNGTTIQFVVRAYKGSPTPTEYSAISNISTITIPATTFNPPTGVTGTPQADNTIRVAWTDASTSEDGVELWVTAQPGGTPTKVTQDIFFYQNQQINVSGLPTGVGYRFKLRAFREGTPRTYTAFSAESATTPPVTMAPPTGVTGTPVSESIIKVSWTDVSASEDGVELWLAQDGGVFSKLGDNLFSQPQQLNVTGLVPGVGYRFKLRAYREGTPRTFTPFSATSATVMSSPPAAPTGLTASNVQATSLKLTWTDNSQVETSFEILTRPTGGGAFTVRQLADSNAMSADVVNLTPGASLDFAVRARADYAAPVLSANSNVITRLMRDVITSPHYAQGLVGQPFSYSLTTTNGSPRISQNISGLPSGLSFDSNTGLVSGTPDSAGVTLASMSATFADVSTHSPGLSIRILNPPVVASAIPAQTLSTGTPLTVPLGGAFSDPEATSAVKVTTTLGAMHFILFDNATPQTVLNFMNYVNVGAYSNNTFHRSVPGFIVQGGSFKPSVAPNNFTSAPRFSPVVNEPGISSIRGTIAMAKIDPDPNSATNDFFVNLENNGANLDVQNGGFTVFGRVAGNGMAVADAIAARPTGSYVVNLDGTDRVMKEWPLDSPDALAVMDNSKVVGITSVAPASVFSYAVTSNTNAGAVTAGISGNNLALTPVAPGTANITVRATTLDGNSVSQTFAVTTRSGVATLANLVSSSGALTPAFASATTAYTATVPNTTASLTLTPTVSQAQATVAINGVSAASGTASSAIPLQVGSNVITALVTAADGVSTKSYTFTVKRTASAPVASTLNAAGVGATGAILNGTVDAKGSSTTASFDYGTTTAYGSNLVAAPSPVTGSSPTATAATLGGLTPGTTYHFRTRGVNSAGTTLGANKTFTTLSAAATLANLTASAGALTPVFSSATTTYALTVPGGTAALTVTPTSSQTAAIVRVNGIVVPAGKPSGAIPLAPGPNAIPILVTAPDGLTTKNYTLTVTRALPPVATTLAATSIGATKATFNGTVNAGGASTVVTFEYGTTTAYGSSVTATPSPVTGTSTTAASATLTTLLPSKTYHYRIKTVSAGGTVTGADAEFSTPSNVATLSSLGLSTGNLSPLFASATTTYAQSVSNATTSLTVTPTLSNPNATVTVNGAIVASGSASGPIALSPGPNTIAVQVRAQDGVTLKTYTVNVTRQASSVATLAGLALSSGTLSPAFTSATTAYTATVPNTTDTLQLTPTLTSNLATVTVKGLPVPFGSPSGAINLNAGSNVITVIATAEDKVTKKTYTVTVTRTPARATVTTAAATGIAAKSAVLHGTINAKGGATTATFDYGTTLTYGSSVAATPSPVTGGTTTAVSATPTGLTPGATYHYRARGVNLAGSETGSDATFSTPSNVATLSGLALNGATLSPAFGSATTTYSSTVPDATTSLTVKPTLGNANATVTVNSVNVASGTPSGPVPLALGSNTITVQVTAQDGVTLKTYTVNVTRLAAPVATTLPVTNLTAVGAKLNGTINALNSSTTVSFVYGLTTAYGSSATATPTPVTGSTEKAVSATLAGLMPDKTYHYQVKGVSTGGTSLGADATFTTPSNVATLASLALGSGTLSPAFASATTAYTASVPNITDTLQLTPTPGNASAIVTVNGTAVASGNASAPINLNVGSNAISVLVTAQDGTTKKTYTVTVTRAAAPASLTTQAATGVGSTVATLRGVVNTANSSSTAVSFDYGLTTSYGSSAAATPTPVTGTASTNVSATIAGLAPNKTYHYRVKGVNAAGTTLNAGNMTFTTVSNTATLSALALSAPPLSPALSPLFSSATTTYSTTVPTETTFLTVTPTLTDANATVTVNSVNVASGSAGGPIALSPGLNTIAVQVTAQDGVTLKTYTLNVTRLAAPVAITLLPTNLTAVGVKLNGSMNALNSGNTTVTFLYGPTTAYGSSIAATPASVTGSATTAVSATLAGLTPGATYHYQVKGVSANGTGLGADTTFTTPSNVATLADIELSAGNLSPAFASATTIYTVPVPNATASITLTPIRSHSAATVNVNGVPVASGSASAPINLNVGSNVITLLVTAQDGTTKKTYTLTVTRASALASLTTQAATGVGTTGATLKGVVNTANSSSTAVSFDYGLTTSYGSSVAAIPTPVTGTASTNVSATLAGLAPNKTYHYRVKGVNVAGTTLNAGDMTFTTVSNTATLSGLALSAPPLSPALSPLFSSATTTYSTTVPTETTSLTVTPTLTDAKATVAVNSVIIASGSASGPIALSPGLNVIAVQVTAQDGVTLKTYTVNVTRLALPVATTLPPTNLTAVGAKLNGTLNALNSSTAVTFVYGPTTAYGSSITATPTPVTGSTTTAVGATIAGLTPGATYHYQVKGVSAGGTSLGADATFTTPSNVATLASLAPSSGTLSPAFASATTAYTATVPNTTASLTLTPALGDASAIVTVNGAPVAFGSPSGAINLNLGGNAITVLVTAQDGTTKKTYTVNVTRTALAPAMTTLAATGVSGTSAILNGTATANHANTTVTFDFGPTTAYGSSIAAAPSPLTGTAVTPVSATLNGLSPGATYQYRVKGVNATGTTPGTNLTFTTPSNVASLSGLVLSTSTLSPLFASATTTYSQTVPNTTTSLTVKPTATSAAATLLLNGALIFSGSTSGAIALEPGPNIITVQVTAQDGVTTTVYTVTVNRTTPAPTVVTQQADNVNATGATVHGTVNAQGTSTNVTFDYGLTTAYGSSAVAAESPVNGSGVTPVSAALTGLQAGATYHYRVSALNAGGLSSGLDATFTTPSNVTTLSGLALSTGALTPAFTSATTTYAQTVPNETPSLTVTPTATHPEATLLLNGAPIGSGGTSTAIALSPGPNIITVQVTAQDGIATGTYTINVTRTTPVPTVATLPADNVTTTGATLHGTVNAEGTSTTAGFEYGLTSAYGSSAAAVESPLNGGSATPVTAALTGLQPGTTYHYRVTGQNVGGPSNGLDATFTTISTTATLSGLAFSTGSPSPAFASATTSYTVTVPDATTSITVTPTATSAAATLLLNGAAFASGSTSNAIPLSTGLNVITVQVTAQDGVTSLTYTVNITRTVPAPAVITQAADQVGQTGATLHGTVNAQGAGTTVSFEYGLTTAYGSSIAAAESLVSGTSATPVTAAPTGLLHGRIYHYRVTATNEGGPSDGLDMTFTTLHADVLATLTPASTSSTSATPVVLQVTGLVPGEPVTVDRFVDSDADGTVDPDEFLAGTFAVTDGQVTSIAGVRNTNVPGDEDGATDGQASIHIVPLLGSELGRVAGAQLVRISSPTVAFPPLLRPLTVTQPAESQSISGTVTDGTNPVPHASVVLLDADDNTGFARGVVADAAGQFTLNAPAGAYTIFAVRSGYVGTFQPITLGAGSPLTQDLELSPATTSIAGKIANAGTDSGLGGVQLFAQTQGGRVAVLSSNADGTFVAPVTADQWQIKASDASLGQLSHLGLEGESDAAADTSSAAATGANISVPIVTALIHGTVTDSSANLLPGIWLEAGDSNHLYRSVATTNASGHYVLGAKTGSWVAGIPGDSPGLAGYVIPTDQSVIFTGAQATQTDFTLIATAAQISGHVKDSNNQAVSGVRVSGSSAVAGIVYSISAVTDSVGSYSLPVFLADWTVGVSSADLLAQGYQPPPDQYVLVDTGSVTVDFNTGLSSNAKLAGLVSSSGALSPAFASTTTDYTATVSNATVSLTVTPTTSHSGATVTVNSVPVISGSASGAILLNEGANVITIAVTAQNGTSTTNYVLTVTREAPMAPSPEGDEPAPGNGPAATMGAGITAPAAGSGAVKARLTGPVANGGVLPGANVSFTWDAGAGASEYWLSIGTTVAGTDLHDGSQGGGQACTIDNLPGNGSEIHVTLKSWINGAWLANHYAFRAADTTSKAVLSAPANESKLGAADTTFTWNAVEGAGEYWLSIGSVEGGADVYDASQGTALNRTVSLPADGRELFVSLRTRVEEAWASSDTTLFAVGSGAPAGAQINSPANHSALTGATVTFTWDAGSGASEYWLGVGSNTDAMDVFSASQGTGQSATLTLPADGSPLYVTLFSRIAGVWRPNQYLYEAALPN